MPRTVNVSERNGHRENKKQVDAPGETGFFGMRRLWTSNSPAVSLEVDSTDTTLPLEAVADPTVEEDSLPLFPTDIILSGTANQDTEATYALAEQIIAKVVPAEIVATNGDVDFDLLFQSAQLPPVTVNADHAVHVLESIPAEMPLHVKRLLVKTSLSVMTNLVQENSVSADIVSDAAQKMLWIARLQKNVTAEIDADRENVHAEIALLEAQIAAKNKQLAEAESRANTALQSCRHRADQLHNVTLFFDPRDEEGNNGGKGNHSGSEEDGQGSEKDELPSYLREDSVLRLLGLHETNELEDDISGRRVPVASAQRNGALQYA